MKKIRDFEGRIKRMEAVIFSQSQNGSAGTAIEKAAAVFMVWNAYKDMKPETYQDARHFTLWRMPTPEQRKKLAELFPELLPDELDRTIAKIVNTHNAVADNC